MIVKAIIHAAEEGGFWAEVPAMPGCATQGETLEEIRENLREAAAAWLGDDDPDEEVYSGERAESALVEAQDDARAHVGPYEQLVEEIQIPAMARIDSGPVNE